MKDPQPTSNGQGSDEKIESDHSARTELTNTPLNEKPASASEFAQYRLRQDYTAMSGISKPMLHVPTQRPNKQWWFTVNPDKAYQDQFAVVEMSEDREHFLVAPNMVEHLRGEYVAKMIFTCQTRQQNTFLWPIRLPDEFGKLDTWNESALRIANEYAGQWIRVSSNRQAGCYDVVVAEGDTYAPVWPDKSFDEILERAFKGKVIDDYDHPVLKQLRGEFQ